MKTAENIRDAFKIMRSPAMASIFLLLTMSADVFAQTRIQADSIENLKITVNRSVPAQTLSLRQATLSSQLSTTVTELPLLVGDQIQSNQLVSRLDCADNELLLQQAKSELTARSANRVLARQQLDRLNKLKATNNASDEQINQKQAEVNVANAQINAQSIAIKIAQRQVVKCELRSPFAGTVSAVHSEIGNFVTPGSSIVSLIDTDNIELEAQVSYSELEQIKQSKQLLFLYQEQTFPVSIRTTVEVIDSKSQSRRMRLVFSELKPLPGASGRLQWSLPGTIIPAPLIVSRNNQNGVFIVDKSSPLNLTAKFIVLPGIKQGQPGAVNLSSDTLIITDGRFGLADGEQIVLE